MARREDFCFLSWIAAALDVGGDVFNDDCGRRGLPVLAPARIRPFVVAVIGVMLGARFTSEILGQLQVWAGTLSLLLLFVLISAAVVVPFYRFVGGFDWKTAYFAGMPGGLAEMVEIGEARGPMSGRWFWRIA